jgi:integrase
LNRLKTIFDQALFEDLIAKDPTMRIPPLSVTPREKTPFSIPQVFTFLKALPDAWRPNEWRNYFRVLFFIGMRPGELQAVRVSDVCLEPSKGFPLGYIDIRRSHSRFGEGPTKTKKSKRRVPVMPLFHESVKEQCRLNSGNAPLFCDENGEPWNQDHIRKEVWYPTLDAVNAEKPDTLPAADPYITRHTFITNALKSGEDRTWVAAVVGHTTSKLTDDIYNIFVPSSSVGDGDAFTARVRSLE